MNFEEYYTAIFRERWEILREALLSPNKPMELRIGNAEPYFLDEASFFAAKALDVKPCMDVLDMCAAPGGKSLVLANALAGTGSLQSNDRSNDRRERLRRVIMNSLPKEYASVVCVSGYSGERFGKYRAECFDRILVDAPCSSERHVLSSPEHLAMWSPKRIKRLAIEQGSLLASAVDALKPLGEVVYSTCALSRDENDGVIEKILKKRKGIVEVVSLEPYFEGTEPTEYGLHMLPDKCQGRGPIFCAKLRKKA